VILNSIVFDFANYGTRLGNRNFVNDIGSLKREGNAPEDNNTNKSGALL
jgi:hypothetical protein